METNYISRHEFEAVTERLDAENVRQNHRIDTLEKLTESVQKLAVNMEHMATEQQKQSECIRKLENRDGEKWRQAFGYFVMAVVSSIVTVLFAKFGL